jgi:multidrug efflux system membrane fusion protein
MNPPPLPRGAASAGLPASRSAMSACAALTIALTVTLLSACQPPPAAVEPVRAVRTWVVGTTQAQPQLEFAAEVRARVESRLGFRVPGKLVERTAQLGQTVRAGQTLAPVSYTHLRAHETLS